MAMPYSRRQSSNRVRMNRRLALLRPRVCPSNNSRMTDGAKRSGSALLTKLKEVVDLAVEDDVDVAAVVSHRLMAGG